MNRMLTVSNLKANIVNYKQMYMLRQQLFLELTHAVTILNYNIIVLEHYV